MAAKSGLFGSAVITSAGTVPGTATIVGIGEWSISIDHPIVEITAFGDAWQRYLPSIRGWSGSFSGNTDTDTSQTTLKNAVLGGSVIAMRLYDSATTYWSGTAGYITGNEHSISYDGKGDSGWDFTGDGALAYV